MRAIKYIDKSKIRRVLAIKLRHIGDVLLASATFGALKKAIPTASLTVLVPAGTEDMLTLNPAVDEVIPYRKGLGVIEDLRFIQKLRNNCYDLAINMTEGDRGTILAFLSGARYRIGVDPAGRGFMGKRLLLTHPVAQKHAGRHRALIDMDLLAPLGIGKSAPLVELFTSKDHDDYVAKLLGESAISEAVPFVVVHPTSRWLFKCWRAEAVAELLERLEERGLRVVLTCGPDKKEKLELDRILSITKSDPLVLSGALSLKQFAALLKRCTLFFGVDSAPMHMAAALDKPVVALFGPSDSREWGPLTSKGKIIEKSTDFPCIPCYRDGCNGSKQSKCLDAVTVEEVVGEIEKVLIRHTSGFVQVSNGARELIHD